MIKLRTLSWVSWSLENGKRISEIPVRSKMMGSQTSDNADLWPVSHLLVCIVSRKGCHEVKQLLKQQAKYTMMSAAVWDEDKPQEIPALVWPLTFQHRMEKLKASLEVWWWHKARRGPEDQNSSQQKQSSFLCLGYSFIALSNMHPHAKRLQLTPVLPPTRSSEKE